MTIDDLPVLEGLREQVTKRCLRQNKQGKCAGCGCYLSKGDIEKMYDLLWCFQCYERRQLAIPLREEP